MSKSVSLENNNLSNLFSGLLSDLRLSYAFWDDLSVKSAKFQSALNLFIRTFSAFTNSIQQLADVALKSHGVCNEIGAHLTRLCMRQQYFEIQLKTMSNCLVNGLATPLPSKMDKWRRQLQQLEKDRNRQTKRARTELFKAQADAKRARKKSKCNNSLPVNSVSHWDNGNNRISESDLTALPPEVANAFREVQTKSTALELVERSALRSLMLEERGRFCFLVCSLLPVLDCQLNMLNEITTIKEIIQALSHAANDPERLPTAAESLLLEMGLGENRNRLPTDSLSFHAVESRNSCLTVPSAISNERGQVDLSDADSGPLQMGLPTTECKLNGDSDSGCLNSFSSKADCVNANESGDTRSSYSYFGSNTNHGDVSVGPTFVNNLDETSTVSAFPGRFIQTAAPSTPASINSPTGSDTGLFPQKLVAHDRISIGDPVCATVNRRTNVRDSLVTSFFLSQSSHSLKEEDTQFSTLRKSGRPSFLTADRPAVDPEWLRVCVDSEDSEDSELLQPANEDNQQTMTVVSVDGETEEAGDYVEVHKEHEAQSLYPNQSKRGYGNSKGPSNSTELNYPVSGRHTISSAYERGGAAGARSTVNSFLFTSQTTSEDSPSKDNTVLYPNQALPPPVYTNLAQLADVAKRKFSLNPLSSNSVDIPSGFSSPSSNRSLFRKIASVSHSSLALSRDSLKSSCDFTRSVAAAPGKAHFAGDHQSSLSPHSGNFLGRRVSVTGVMSCYDGLDPCSAEMDNLDSLDGPGVSPPTFNSSATNGSQRSSICTPQTDFSSDLLASSQESRPSSRYAAVPDHADVSKFNAGLSVLRPPPSALPVSTSSTACLTTPTPPSVPPPALWDTNEGTAASLMSELSLQLRQLASHVPTDPVPDHNGQSDDPKECFDLPPPPPPDFLFGANM